MPIYAYACGACGHTVEALQKISDPPLKDCPACGKPELRKQVTAAAFRLKGTGWYETDFKNPSKNKGDTGSKKDAGGEKSKKDSAGKSDSKSDSSSSKSTTTGSSGSD